MELKSYGLQVGRKGYCTRSICATKCSCGTLVKTTLATQKSATEVHLELLVENASTKIDVELSNDSILTHRPAMASTYVSELGLALHL